MSLKEPLALATASAVIMATAIGPAAAIASSAQPPAGHRIFRVDTRRDSHDAHTGDGRCADPAGRCSLRAAVEEANAAASQHRFEIVVPNGAYSLSLGTLEVRAASVDIVGGSHHGTLIDGRGRFRVMHVHQGSVVRLVALTVRGGDAGPTGYGGGILNSGSLTVTGSRIEGNAASAGGGISNSGGRLEIDGSRVADNVATAYGGGGVQNGGLHDRGGAVRLVDTLIAGNTAGGDGGGILNGQNGHPYLASVRSLRLTVIHCRIEGNRDGNGGGGIANDRGTVVVEDTVISANSAGTAVGGGISTDGRFWLRGSVVERNDAARGGGAYVVTAGLPSAIFVATDDSFDANTAEVGGAIDAGATVTVRRSTFASNVAPYGGAVEVEGSDASFVDSTFVGDSAADGHGALETYACGRVQLSYVTFDANSLAIDASCPDVFVTGTIVAGSTGGENCVGALTEVRGHNLDDGVSCGFTEPTDLSGVDPLLGPLGRHGGPTRTMPLEPGSPAIDAGGGGLDGCPSVDQRSRTRPSGLACDIGAFEVQHH